MTGQKKAFFKLSTDVLRQANSGPTPVRKSRNRPMGMFTLLTVGPPFFNNVNIPIGLFLLFLTGVGPLFAWRKTSVESLKKAFFWPVIFSVPFCAALMIAGMRDFYAVVSFTLCVFVLITVVREFYKGASVRAKNTGESFLSAIVNLTLKNKRLYGGYIVHVDIVVIFVGMSGYDY